MGSKFLVKIVKKEDLPEDCDIVGCIGAGDESYILILDSSGVPRAYSDLVHHIEDVHFGKALHWIPEETKKTYRVGYSDGVNDTLVKIFGRRLLRIFKTIKAKFEQKTMIESEKVESHMITKRRKVYVEDDSIRTDGGAQG